MPSEAYLEFNQNLTDVHRLVLLHRQVSGTGRGRRGLGHLTRGGLLLLCAAWERYVETAIVEGAQIVANKLPGINALPPSVRQKVQNHANNNSTVWSAAQLGTPQWGQVYIDAITRRVDKLHTPKHHKLQPIFQDFLAVADIEAAWSEGKAPIDDFVALRGEVAHRGGQSRYIHFWQLENFESKVTQYVQETDNYLSDHLRTLVNPRRRPWNRIAT
jgi:RiboL-PSP-HEPN